MGILVPTHPKKISYRDFHGRFRLIVPVNSNNREAPVSGRGHPDLLDGTGTFNLGHGKRFAGVNGYKRVHLPSLSQVTCGTRRVGRVPWSIRVGRCHPSFPFLTSKIFWTNRSRFGVRKPVEISHVHIKTVKFSVLSHRHEK